MSCAFCRVTPVDPCPVCAPAEHTGRTQIRKPRAGKRPAVPPPPPVRQATVDAWAKQAMPVIGAAVAGWAPGGTLGSRSTADRLADNAKRIAELEAKLREAAPGLVKPNGRATWEIHPEAPVQITGAPVPGIGSRARYTPPPSNPRPPLAIVPQRPAQPARVGVLTPCGPEEWRAAEKFVRATLWAPRLVDSTAKPVPTQEADGDATHPPISRGDFKGLWVAVEAGHLSEQDAIEIAASWRTLGMAGGLS